MPYIVLILIIVALYLEKKFEDKLLQRFPKLNKIINYTLGFILIFSICGIFFAVTIGTNTSGFQNAAIFSGIPLALNYFKIKKKTKAI